ncbi:MAG: hypothetical protein OXC07_11340, partial [Kistimonas sp.]|nr:hypothetical protein [Kistimonas sp.]
ALVLRNTGLGKATGRQASQAKSGTSLLTQRAVVIGAQEGMLAVEPARSNYTPVPGVRDQPVPF